MQKYSIKKLKSDLTEVVTKSELDKIPVHFLESYTVTEIPQAVKAPESISDIVKKKEGEK